MALQQKNYDPALMYGASSDITSNQTITDTTSGALAVGPNGATNPTFNIDCSTSSAATGINLKSAAAAGGMAVSVLSSGTNENLTVDAKGSGTITFGGTSTGAISLARATTCSSTLQVTGATTLGAASSVTTGSFTITNGDLVVTKNAGKLSFTGTGANGGVILNPKNNANTTVSGTAITIEISIGGTPYYFLAYPTNSA